MIKTAIFIFFESLNTLLVYRLVTLCFLYKRNSILFKISLIFYFTFSIISKIIFNNILDILITEFILFLFIMLSFVGQFPKKVMVSLIILLFNICFYYISNYISNFFIEEIRRAFFRELTFSVLMLFLTILIHNFNIDKTNEYYLNFRNSILFLLIPILSIYLIISIILVNHELIFLNDKQEEFQTLSIIFIILIINITMILYFNFLIRHRSKELEEKNIIQEKNAYLKQLSIMDNREKDIKIIRHDLKNHLTIILGLLEKNEYSQINNYIKTILNTIELNHKWIDSGNNAVDSILNYKFSEAYNYNIQIESYIKIPQILKIDNYHLVSILGNLLDNAINATKEIENKYIKVKIFYKIDLLVINVINPFNVNINKKRDDNHGLGLKSVEKSVKYYNGKIYISKINNEFNVQVII